MRDGLESAVNWRTRNFQDLIWSRPKNNLRFELAVGFDIPKSIRDELPASKEFRTFRYEAAIGEGKEGQCIESERGILKSSTPRERKKVEGRQTSLFPDPLPPPLDLPHARWEARRTNHAEYPRAFLDSYRYALVLFDLDGSGSHKPREETEREVDGELSRNGWKQRAKAIVVEPELEIWIRGASRKVPEILGWNRKYAELRRWLGEQGLWPEENDKPLDPKEAMRRTMREARSRRSPRKFFELASTISLKGCRDPSFGDFKHMLRWWFPPQDRHREHPNRWE